MTTLPNIIIDFAISLSIHLIVATLILVYL
jgi:hypothetical protein